MRKNNILLMASVKILSNAALFLMAKLLVRDYDVAASNIHFSSFTDKHFLSSILGKAHSIYHVSFKQYFNQSTNQTKRKRHKSTTIIKI